MERPRHMADLSDPADSQPVEPPDNRADQSSVGPSSSSIQVQAIVHSQVPEQGAVGGRQIPQGYQTFDQFPEPERTTPSHRRGYDDSPEPRARSFQREERASDDFRSDFERSPHLRDPERTTPSHRRGYDDSPGPRAQQFHVPEWVRKYVDSQIGQPGQEPEWAQEGGAVGGFQPQDHQPGSLVITGAFEAVAETLERELQEVQEFQAVQDTQPHTYHQYHERRYLMNLGEALEAVRLEEEELRDTDLLQSFGIHVTPQFEDSEYLAPHLAASQTFGVDVRRSDFRTISPEQAVQRARHEPPFPPTGNVLNPSVGHAVPQTHQQPIGRQSGGDAVGIGARRRHRQPDANQTGRQQGQADDNGPREHTLTTSGDPDLEGCASSVLERSGDPDLEGCASSVIEKSCDRPSIFQRVFARFVNPVAYKRQKEEKNRLWKQEKEQREREKRQKAERHKQEKERKKLMEKEKQQRESERKQLKKNRKREAVIQKRLQIKAAEDLKRRQRQEHKDRLLAMRLQKQFQEEERHRREQQEEKQRRALKREKKRAKQESDAAAKRDIELMAQERLRTFVQGALHPVQEQERLTDDRLEREYQEAVAEARKKEIERMNRERQINHFGPADGLLQTLFSPTPLGRPTRPLWPRRRVSRPITVNVPKPKLRTRAGNRERNSSPEHVQEDRESSPDPDGGFFTPPSSKASSPASVRRRESSSDRSYGDEDQGGINWTWQPEIRKSTPDNFSFHSNRSSSTERFPPPSEDPPPDSSFTWEPESIDLPEDSSPESSWTELRDNEQPSPIFSEYDVRYSRAVITPQPSPDLCPDSSFTWEPESIDLPEDSSPESSRTELRDNEEQSSSLSEFHVRYSRAVIAPR